MRLDVLLDVLGLLKQVFAADVAVVVHLLRHRLTILKYRVVSIGE